jgi:hypothetical protein
MVYLHNFIGSFSIHLMGENEEDVEPYEEEGYRDDTNLNEVEDVGEDLDSEIEAWVELAKAPSKCFFFFILH